jgi:hypothetical protein
MIVVFFVLSGKGGIGKSWLSSALLQYFKERYKSTVGIDVDPSNNSFAAYKALKVIPLKLLNNGNIDRRCFDELIETILSENNRIVVVDIGSGPFIPLLSYMVENESFSFLQKSGVKTILIPILVGGEAAVDTGNSFVVLSELGLPMIAFENSFFGPVEIGGKPCSDWKPVIEANKKGLISGVVSIGGRSKDLFGEDIRAMSSKKMTFSEAINMTSGFSLMKRQRIKTVCDDLFDQLDLIMHGVIDNDS